MAWPAGSAEGYELHKNFPYGTVISIQAFACGPSMVSIQCTLNNEEILNRSHNIVIKSVIHRVRVFELQPSIPYPGYVALHDTKASYASPFFGGKSV